MSKCPYIIATFSLFLALVVSAQELERPYSILQFRGVDNATNELIPSEQGTVSAEECVNFFLNGGVLNKRPGYVGRYHTTDSLRGIFGYRTNSGKPRLFAIRRSDQWHDLLIYSDFYKSATSNTVNAYFYSGATPSWAVWDDILIIMNGKNWPWRWNGTNLRPLVNNPPGTCELAPIPKHAAGYFLHGDYYYAIQNAEPCSVNITGGGDETSWSTIGQVIGPVHVDSGMVTLYYWPHLTNTDICTVDSSIYRICRTRAGATPNDSFFVRATHRFADTYDQGALTFTDSGRDVDLSAYAGKWDTAVHIADTASDTFYHVGQPTWLGTTVGTGGGIGVGIDDELVDYYRYGIAWYDSSTGMTSPLGPICRIPAIKGGGPTIITDSVILLGVYTRPSKYGHLWRILFRAREYEDSLRLADSSYQNRIRFVISGNRWEKEVQKAKCAVLKGEVVWVNGEEVCQDRAWSAWWKEQKHTRIGPFYPVDTVKDSSTETYNDTISWKTLETRDPYLPIIPTGQWNYPVLFQNRLFAAEGSKVYFTAPGKVAQFENYFPVNLDDGDIITGMQVVNDELVIFKTYSVHKAYPAGDGYESREFISGIGCIAPHSITIFPGGGFGFLSYQGYFAFTGWLRNPYKESGGNIDNISGPIQKHLDNYTTDQLWQCHACWGSNYQNLFLNFPTLDTTWIYAVDGSGWSAATFAFRQTTMYDTTYKVEPRQSVDLFAVEWGTDSIYVFGDSFTDHTVGRTYNLDKGDTITATYKTRALGKDYWLSQLTDYGLWIDSDETTQVKVYFYDQNGHPTDTVVDSTGLRYHRKATNNDPSYYWQIKLETKADSCAIQGLDLWIKDPSEPKH